MIDKDFPKKWAKKLEGTNFAENVETNSDDELEQQILKSEGLVADTEKEMENDDKLNAIKDELKDLRGGYMDAINFEKAKTKYCLHLLRLRGKR